MATSKLIKPTNVTVSIPEFTDQPDQRVNSNCIDKIIDGVNSLNDQIANFVKRREVILEPGALSAGASGYLTGTAPEETGYKPWTLEYVPASIGSVGGSLVLNGTIIPNDRTYYIGYYALTALSATNAKIAVRILYIKNT